MCGTVNRMMLDRFDGPDYRRASEPDGEDACEASHRQMEDRLCGQMANDWDPHEPTHDKEETR